MASKRQITVGGVPIGGGAPVVVQSMTLTKTHDVEATMAQIGALASAGCEIVRVAVPKSEDADALPLLVRLSPLPVIADIHFNASLALFNLLPLLPLDGGHILFSLAEGIRGRAIAREIYERVSAVGIAVFLLLFVVGLSNDVGRLGG